jgi:hypothetical protein
MAPSAPFDPDEVEEPLLALSTIPEGADPSRKELPHCSWRVEFSELSKLGKAVLTVL